MQGEYNNNITGGFGWTWILLALAFAGATVLGPTHAATLTVINTDDSGAGSLRQAIADAVAGDAITFDSALAGSTITLTSGELVLDKDLSINGDQNSDGVPDVTVSGNDTFRVFFVSDGAVVSLEGLVITAGAYLLVEPFNKGDGGGGIHNSDGTVTLTNSTVSGNRSGSISGGGGGIFNSDGTMTLINSTVSGNRGGSVFGGGGGIFNGIGTVTLTNSTVSGNLADGGAGRGGGIYNSNGTVTLTNSTVSGNKASWNNGTGGGIYNSDGTVTLTNSTVSGNHADSRWPSGGGIYNSGGTVTLTNSTVSGNRAFFGGGILNRGTVTLTNTTVSGNIGWGSGAISSDGDGQLVNTIIANNRSRADCAGTFDIANSANNLIEMGCDAIATLTDDPQLGPLQDNGGPTETHALLSGSPAIDFIPAADCEVAEDQRGILRPEGSHCDIGAFERQQGVGPLPPTTLVLPNGTTSDNTPTYIWSAVSNSTWYYLWVQNSSGTPVHVQWYTAAQTECDNIADHCLVTPEITLADGAYTWRIQTWNDSGYGPWSSGMDFTVNSGPPPATTLVSPSRTISNNTPTYIWRAVWNSTWYYLWVQNSSGTPIHRQWYTAAQTDCSSGTGICSVTPETTVSGGYYTWWIQTWNANAYGPWSSGLKFSVRSDAMLVPSLLHTTFAIKSK